MNKRQKKKFDKKFGYKKYGIKTKIFLFPTDNYGGKPYGGLIIIFNNKTGKCEKIYVIRSSFESPQLLINDIMKAMDLLKNGIIPYPYITRCTYIEDTFALSLIKSRNIM
jgi:hypothetical protein